MSAKKTDARPLKNFKFGPNPFSDQFWVSFPTVLTNGKIQILDIAGRRLFNKNIPSGFKGRYRVFWEKGFYNNLNPGSYLLKISSETLSWERIVLKKR